ncbi:hypothetical protein LCGC14_0526130 [marine sediment metagenome]|uniref:Uncharacterized protein n=1 Tax=marine sediment metagenome TaxID=412755 RepID=A0A0F9V525_9ZZZZ
MIKINWTKIGIIIAGVLLAVLVVFNVKQCNDNDNLQSQLVEMKQLQDGIVRSQAKYASKEDIEKLAKDIDLNLAAIEDDLEGFNAKVQGISVLLAQSIGRDQTDVPSTSTRPKPVDVPTPFICPGTGEPCEDSYGHLTNAQLLALSELFPDGLEVPIGDVTFESWKENPWTTLQHPRDYHVTTVLGQDEDGRHYTYHKFEIGVAGERHTVPITNSEFIEEYPEPSFHWWNPRVGIGVYGGVGFNTSPLPDESVVLGAVSPTVSFSPFSYGKTKVKPDWVFARVGVGYDLVQRSVSFSIAPAMLNLGTEIDFVQSTYIGPVVGADTDGNVSVGMGLTTDF